MKHLEPVSSIFGAIQVGFATWIIVCDRRSACVPGAHPPVEKLAIDLKHAWAGHHTP